MTRYQALLQPFRLKHLQLRNRIMSTSHEPAYAEDGRPGLRYRLYHEEKAKGGIALTMIGGSAVVAPDSPPAFGNLHLFDERIVADLEALARAVHAHGAAVMCQITHLGRRTYWNRADWLPVLAPSGVREPAHRSFPKAMEDHDIRRVVRAYGAAARRCREGGLDGIEIEAYGHLLDAFWSPATNRRTDDYGGPLENRMRFGLEVLDEIRAQVGSDYIVGIRMVVDEDMPGGLGREEGLEIARRLVATGMLDFVNVIRGHIDTDEGLAHVIPGMGTPAAPHPRSPARCAPPRRADLPRRAHRRSREREPCDSRRPDRHGRHDPGAHGGSAHRRQDHARRGGAHPPVRRGRLLHRSHLRRRRGALSAQPGDRARGDAAARDRALGSAGAQGRGGRRRPRRARGGAGCGRARPPWCCSRPRPSRAVKCALPPRWRAGARSSASSTGSRARSRTSASICAATSSPRPRTSWRRPPTSW